MLDRCLRILLVFMLLLSTILPSLQVFAETSNGTQEDTNDSSEAEGSEVTGSNSDSAPRLTNNIGISIETAQTIRSGIQKVLVDVGGTGQPVTVQFKSKDGKKENTKLFNSVITSQLQLYEMLYMTGVKPTLDKPIKEEALEEGEALENLEQFIKGYNIINKFLKEQIDVLEATEGHDKNLVEALKLAQLDLAPLRNDALTETNPLNLENIRTHLKTNLNGKTAQALSVYMKYLNDGNNSDDVSELTNASTKDATADTLAVIKQWNALPHIADATEEMKITGITSVNQEWLTALESFIKTMETDNGGTTDGDKATANNSTNPENATSALGRMGSSLFTVNRADNADDDPNKPITNTLGWAIEEDLKKSSSTYDPGPAAKDDFLAMFAATAMYTPFISRVGDKDYVEAYKALFNDSADPIKDDDERVRFPGNALGPLDILNQVQNLKKPLYFYNDLKALGEYTVYGHSTEDVKGVAQLLTVGDLIETIKKKKDLAAITINGVMARDGDSWAFYNYSLNKDGQLETTAGDAESKAVNSSSTVVAGTPIVNKIHADKTVNGGQDNTRVVFEMTYNEANPGAPLLTGALLYNIYEDTVLKSKFEERTQEAVYVDAIGNIVLNDGLIVLPAAANPTYWAMPNLSTGTEHENETWTYNPFTVAFMDTYPAIYAGGTAPSSVNQKKDKKKYLIAEYDHWGHGFVIRTIKNSYKTGFTVSRTAAYYDKFKFEGIPELQENIINPIKNSIGVDDDDEAASSGWWTLGDTVPLQFKNVITQNGDSVFPYLTTQVTDAIGQNAFDTNYTNYRSAIYIAKNMYAYIIGEVKEGHVNVTAADGRSAGGSSIGKLREGFLFNNVTMPVLTGVTNGVEFDKTNAKSDLLTAGGDANVVQKWVLNFSKWLTIKSKEMENILAVAGSDDVSLLKLLYGIFIEYGMYIIFLLLMILVIIFLKDVDFMSSLIKGSTIIGLLTVSLFIIPLFVPWLTGVTSNYFSKSTVLNTLMTRLELTDKVHSVQPAGESGLSVKLYNLSPKQAKDLNEQYLINDKNYLTSKFPVDDNLGLFVEGTELRLDLYSFWRFDPLIIATSDNVNNPHEAREGVTQIYHADHSKSKFMTANDTAAKQMDYGNELVDYYMPFNLLENGFMKTLNTYLIYYDPPKSIVKYPDGMTKSSYIMNTYMKSLAFLAAEPEVADVISKAESPSEYEHFGVSELEVEVVNQMFYPYGDILNLQSWVETEFEDLPQDYANSLWTQAMFKSGYYTPGSGIDKRLHLANKVNRKAYDIIIQMKDTKGLISDETMIKLVALYATFEWNKEVSYMNHTIYPQAPSLNQVSASDIISATVLGQSKQFLFYDTSVISNVYTTDGLPGVIVVDIALLALMTYSIVLSWILPVLVVILIFYSIYLIFTNRKIMPALVFTFKLIGMTVLINLLLVVTINLYQVYENMYLLALFLVIIDALFIFLLWKLLFRRGDRINNSWQRRHLRSNGMDTYGSNYGNPYGYGYDSNTEIERGRMQSYLEESEGVYGRRTSRSSRYDD